MAVEIKEHQGGRVLLVLASGRLDKEDYEQFVPEVERSIDQHGKIRMMVELHDFQGWDAGALWEDIKFDAKHFSDIERLAIVGEKKWEEGMTKFCKPFTTAEIRFFERPDTADARVWVEGL